MQNCTTIHETVLRDIIDLVHDVKDVDQIKAWQNMRSPKSIAQQSAPLICVFPAFFSNSVKLSSASMVAKAQERKFVNLFSLVLAANQISDVESGEEFIKKYHTNLHIDNDINVDTILKAVDDYVVKEQTRGKLSTNYILTETQIRELVKKDIRNLDFELEASYEPRSISNFSILPVGLGNLNNTLIKEDQKTEMPERMIGDTSYVKKADAAKYFSTHFSKLAYERIEANRKETEAHIANVHAAAGEKVKKAAEISKAANEKIAAANLANKNSAEKQRNNIDMAKYKRDSIKSAIVDADVKKANELIETLLTVNVWVKSKDGTDPIPLVFLIGIKVKLYPIESMDMINNIILKDKTNNKLLSLMRATTREISFLKDFLFAIDKAKIDALSHGKRGSSNPIWRVLERRALKGKVKRALGAKDIPRNITSFFVSQEEVDYIKKDSNIDLGDPDVIRPIMDAFGLISFVIIDEAAEVAKFIYDTGNDLYESVAFTSLERETTDGGFKKAINLISKIV